MNKFIIASILLCLISCKKENKQLQGPVTIRYEVASSNPNGEYQFSYFKQGASKIVDVTTPWTDEETIYTFPEHTTYWRISFTLVNTAPANLDDMITATVYVNGKLEKQVQGTPRNVVNLQFDYRQ